MGVVKGEDTLTEAELHARRIEDIIAKTKMAKEQGLFVSSRRPKEAIRRQSTDLVHDVAEDWASHSTAHPTRELSGGSFDSYEHLPDGDAHEYIQEDDFSGTKDLKRNLLRSIARDLNLEAAGLSEPMHKTLPSTISRQSVGGEIKYYVDPQDIIPPHAIGVNCPTSVAPSDLFACVNKFAANHTDENWERKTPEPKPESCRYPNSELLLQAGPPPGSEGYVPADHDIVAAEPTSPSQYGPSGVYAKRYRQKYKFRKNRAEPQNGYQSADSSFSEDSVDSSASDEYSGEDDN